MAKKVPPHLRRKYRPMARPKRRVVVFCEGKNSEPNYLTEFGKDRGILVVEPVAGAGVPKTLVQKAIDAKRAHARSTRGNSYASGDRFCVAFDCDEHPGLAAAIAAARQHDILIAYSNPCFEIWLLLHCPGVVIDAPIHRHAAQSKLAESLPSYDANAAKIADYKEIRGGYDQACTAALLIKQRREEEGDPCGNPYTDFNVLTELIRTGKLPEDGG